MITVSATVGALTIIGTIAVAIDAYGSAMLRVGGSLLPEAGYLEQSAEKDAPDGNVPDRRQLTFGTWKASCILAAGMRPAKCQVLQPLARGNGVVSRIFTADEGRTFHIVSGPMPFASEARLGRHWSVDARCGAHCVFEGDEAAQLARRLRDGEVLSYLVSTATAATQVELRGHGFAEAVAAARAWRELAPGQF